jgi:hypothetical protein
MEWWSDGKGEGWKIGRMEATRNSETTGRAKLLLSHPFAKDPIPGSPCRGAVMSTLPSFHPSHYSTTPPLHHSTTPLLHYSITPSPIPERRTE